jgi:hypothetical protein
MGESAGLLPACGLPCSHSAILWLRFGGYNPGEAVVRETDTRTPARTRRPVIGAWPGFERQRIESA